jgi:hypothetical protein
MILPSNNSLVNGQTSRVSVASAVHPPNYAIVCPAPDLVDEIHPALYRPCECASSNIRVSDI